MDGIGLAQQPHGPPIHPDQRNIKCQIAIIVLLWATVLAFLAGFLILVAKIKFVRKVLAAKVDVNIFNHTLALCLIASGNKRKKRDFQLLSGVATMLFLPLTVWLLGNNYGEVAN